MPNDDDDLDHDHEPTPEAAPEHRPGGATDPDAAEHRAMAGATLWSFLPIGITFLVLGITQGIGDGSGTAFFVVGVTFLVLALTTGGTALAARRAPAAPDAAQAPGAPGEPADGAEDR